MHKANLFSGAVRYTRSVSTPLSCCYRAPLCAVSRRTSSTKAKAKSADDSLEKGSKDKSLNQFREVVEWWEKNEKRPLKLSACDTELRTRFLKAREDFKSDRLRQLREYESVMDEMNKRKSAALNALPKRLSFAARVTVAPDWNSVLNMTQTPMDKAEGSSSDSSGKRGSSSKKKKSKNNKQGSDKAASLSAEERWVEDTFPVAYDPRDIRTQPAYVRSLFDYAWTEGTVAPIRREGVSNMGSTEEILSEERDAVTAVKSGVNLYGSHDTFGEHTRSVKVSNFFGVADTTTKLKMSAQKSQQPLNVSKEEIRRLREVRKRDEQARRKAGKDGAHQSRSMTPAERKQMERDKAYRKAAMSDWMRRAKGSKNRRVSHGQFVFDEETGVARDYKEVSQMRTEEQELARKERSGLIEDNEEDEHEMTESMRKQREIDMEERQLLFTAEVPSLAQLVTDPEVNEEFFSKTLRVFFRRWNEVDDSKQEQILDVVKQYSVLGEHIGYGNPFK